MVQIMGMTVLPVRMIVQPAENHGPAGAAGCRCAIGICESHALGGQPVEIRRLGGFIAIGPGM